MFVGSCRVFLIFLKTNPVSGKVYGVTSRDHTAAVKYALSLMKRFEDDGRGIGANYSYNGKAVS